MQVSKLSKTLSTILRRIRVDHGDSQQKASEKLNISRCFISELEKGGRNVTLFVLEKYSKAYGIDIFMLIFLAEKKWRIVNSPKYSSYKELEEEYYKFYKEKHREYIKSELKKLVE